ncbi:hypothetical protein SO802_021210 [Lithocarpus litseifolius]|uniref:DUF8040 domain-containing protein n=1 Tax=Lithocarpus litseifolius TaxID=425828 RepID=A0AAW2CH56_9ROSI
MFCMTLRLFFHLVDVLKRHGYLLEGRGRVNVQEPMAMFLYIVRHNTHMQFVAKKFQHSTEMVSHKFQRVLQAVHTYGKHLIRPNSNVVGFLKHLQVNKYYPWFKKCIGTIDGTHISARPPTDRSQPYRSRKNIVTTNVMCVCDYDKRFMYVHSGSYYLVDLGYPIGASFLPPHKSTRYHAQEFRMSNRQPKTGKELYNYWHSSLHKVANVVDEILFTQVVLLWFFLCFFD